MYEVGLPFVCIGEYNLVISEITVEDDALFECQVGATEQSPGLVSRRAKLTVQGFSCFFNNNIPRLHFTVVVIFHLIVLIVH